LGILCKNQGKLAEAEVMYQRALAGYEKTLGPEHRATLKMVKNLSTLYADQGKVMEAETMYVRALQGYENAVGASYPRTRVIARSLNRLRTSS
jgi:tetratricopeptide (TPR) repeat protein